MKISAGQTELTRAASARRLPLPTRLPNLEAWRADAIRTAYVALAAVALIVLAGSFWVNARDMFGNIPTTLSYGFRTHTDDAGVARVRAVAQRSGQLRRGDLILAIDGEAVPADVNEFTIAEMLAADTDGRVTMVTRSTNGAVRSLVLDRQPVAADMSEPSTGLPLWFVLGLVFLSTQLPATMWIGASILLAWRRPRDPQAMLLAVAFALLTINARTGFWLTVHAGVPQITLTQIENFGGTLLLIGAAAFPNGRFENLPGKLAPVFAAPLAIVILVPELIAVQTVLAAALIVLAILAVVLRFRSASGIERQQMKWATLGFVATLVPILLRQFLNLAEPGLTEATWFIVLQFTTLFLLFVPLGLLVSMLNYRLYDAETVISRSAGYAVLTLMLGAVFAATAKAMEIFFESRFGDLGALPGVVAAALAVILITPLHNRVHRWAERRFQKSLTQLKRDLPECISNLRETASMQELLDEVLERVSTGVRAVRAGITIDGRLAAARGIEAGALPAAEISVESGDGAFPVRVPLEIRHGREAPTGCLLLGPRPDGSLYGQDEREALDEIADPVARAIEFVQMREAREEESEGWRRRQERRLQRLEAAMAKIARADDRGGSAPPKR